MLEVDSDALESDLAETYHIYDYKELPLRKVALFSANLRSNSRIKMQLSGIEQPLETVLLAHCVDYLALLLWTKTKDAECGANKPKSVLAELIHKENEDEYECFETGEEFEKVRNEILEEVRN